MPPPRRVAKRVDKVIDKVEAAALTNGEPSRQNGAKDSMEALEAEEAMAQETATVERAPLSARSAPRPPCPSESEPSASTALGKRKAACKPPAPCAVAGFAAPPVRQRRGMQQLEWSGELARV